MLLHPSNINTVCHGWYGCHSRLVHQPSWATNGYLLCNAMKLMSYTVASATWHLRSIRAAILGTTGEILHATGASITHAVIPPISKSNWLSACGGRLQSRRNGIRHRETLHSIPVLCQPEYYNGTTWVGVAPNLLIPQTYISTVAGTPIVTSNQVSQTNLFVNPYQGNLLPVPVNGIFTVQTFATATVALSASQTTANIYDIYGFISTTNSTLTFGISAQHGRLAPAVPLQLGQVPVARVREVRH